MVSTDLSVVIKDETHSLLEEPGESSALVLAEKKELLGTLDLKRLVQYIGHVGKFIQIAQNGVNAAGPQFVDLQLQVQRIGYDITSLCDKSAVTIESFRDTAQTVTTRLVSIYRFLLDGFENVAVMSIKSLEGMAKDMAKAALELKEEFENEKEKVISALESTSKKKAEESIRKTEMKQEQEKMEAEREEHKKLVDKYYELAEEAKMEREKYEAEEDRELSKSHIGMMRLVGVAIIGSMPFGKAGELLERMYEKDARESEKRAKRYAEKAQEKREIEREKEQLLLEGLKKMSDFACKIQSYSSASDLAKVAEDALHEACGALRHLSAIMMEASLFWQHIEKHCQKLADPHMKDQIDLVVQMDDKAEKKRFWQSEGFKIEAIQYHARWVALRNVCGEYMFQIKATREDLYAYIKENPTYDESLKNLQALTEDFKSILDNAQKEIKEEAKEKDQKMLEN